MHSLEELGKFFGSVVPSQKDVERKVTFVPAEGKETDVEGAEAVMELQEQLNALDPRTMTKQERDAALKEQGRIDALKRLNKVFAEIKSSRPK